ncbi:MULTISPECIES: helix-turn-helix transcriptional regulator [unclassified Caballeronia]|uniref:helix-turn-helix transcriptional regulator n=1 Tax=unclassified Caballeronia TaxID=2646786 RepID=UPI00285C491B|nr:MULTISPECIES: helix-turn-helix transcriptional regulator [unclassified Caballeronia]MDR5739263.1 helix-turn-helix transcriptional regulator [Caballeronia sp. LZ016]MDR5807753.1 helix-turn-helix transcriptional regulator [Caballeronia sp. LZ019]
MQQVVATPAQLEKLLAAGRRRAGLTQAQAASRLGISQSRVSTLERNPGALTLDQLLAMLGAYGLQLVVQDRPELPQTSPPAESW